MKLSSISVLIVAVSAVSVFAEAPLVKVVDDRPLVRSISIGDTIRIDAPKTWCVVAPKFTFKQTNWSQLDPISREQWNPRSLHNSSTHKSLLRLERYSDIKTGNPHYSEVSIVQIAGDSARDTAAALYERLSKAADLNVLLTPKIVETRVNGKLYYTFRVSMRGSLDQYAFTDSEIGVVLVQSTENSRTALPSKDAERLVGRIYVDRP